MPKHTTPTDLDALSAYFPADDLEWKPQIVRNGQALALAYVTSRALMDRLDSVAGPAGWKNEFKPAPNDPHGKSVLCGISVRVVYDEGGEAEWVTKWDGAENTDIEPVKGGLTGSFKRAAVQWGIGRYLYFLPEQWVPCDVYKGRDGKERFKKFSKRPSVPSEFLPPDYAARIDAMRRFVLANSDPKRAVERSRQQVTHWPQPFRRQALALLDDMESALEKPAELKKVV